MGERRRRLNLGDRTVEVADVNIVTRKGESVAEYELEDGTVIRVATPITSVFRMDSYDIEGKPIYLAIPGTAVTVVEVPETLRKK
jgi:hypothetical protein